MHLLYVHGLGGSLRAQPEIEAVFLPVGFRVVRIPVPYHDNPLELFGRLATLTFTDLCPWIHEGAETLIRTAQLFAPEEYAVVGDSLGGFISVVAAQRDSRISHCVLLACSGDICDAATRLHRLNRALALVVGRFAPGDGEDLKTGAHKAASGESSSQREFELVDTLNPDRLSRLCNLLILGDKRDPVAPEAVCLRFAQRVRNATVRMVYDEGRHHPIGKDALERYALPFLRDQPVPPVLMVTSKRRTLAGIERLLFAVQETLRRRSRGRNRPAP
jgi:pimeloyl-ACP methyl ester carboxylesterase